MKVKKRSLKEKGLMKKKKKIEERLKKKYKAHREQKGGYFGLEKLPPWLAIKSLKERKS